MKSWKHQICGERWGDCNLPRIKKCHISIMFSTFFTIWGFNDVILLCALLLQRHLTGELATPTVYLDEPTPGNHMTVLDWNVDKFVFSSAGFPTVKLKLVLHLDGDPAHGSLTRLTPSSFQFSCISVFLWLLWQTVLFMFTRAVCKMF